MSHSNFPPDRFCDNVSSGLPPDPFGRTDQTARRSRAACWIAALVLGAGLVLLLCCGAGLLFVHFGMQMIAAEVEAQLADNPVLKEHVGEVQSFDVDWARSLAHEDDDTFVYRVKGSKGEGRVTVKHITDDEGNEQILSAELRLSSGKTYGLVPTHPQ